MSDLDAMLGIDLTDPMQRLARELVEADAKMWDDLIATRKAKGLTLVDVAERLGGNAYMIGQIESERDCHLSTLRRYKLAVLS